MFIHFPNLTHHLNTAVGSRFAVWACELESLPVCVYVAEAEPGQLEGYPGSPPHLGATYLTPVYKK